MWRQLPPLDQELRGVAIEMIAPHLPKPPTQDQVYATLASCPVPIVMAGGKKLPELEAPTMAYNAVRQGACGVRALSGQRLGVVEDLAFESLEAQAGWRSIFSRKRVGGTSGSPKRSIGSNGTSKARQGRSLGERVPSLASVCSPEEADTRAPSLCGGTAPR
jgi:hypothetical protein